MITYKINKIRTRAFLATILAVIIIAPITQTNAQIVVPGLGGAQPVFVLGGHLTVTDPTLNTTAATSLAKDALRFSLSLAAKTLLETLKRQLLNRIVNDTVQWIRTGGGGGPRFVTDFKGTVKSVASGALGQTIYELGGANICTGNLKVALGLSLTQKNFSENVQCTLGQIRTNLTNFARDFRNGGWLAFQSLQEPQNNFYGLDVITQYKLMQNKAVAQQELDYESTVGKGFLGQKRCLQWVSVSNPGETRSGQAFWYETPDGVRYNGTTSNPQGSAWRCTSPETVTPGTTIGDQVSKAVGSSVDYIVNSQNLSQYVSAIVNALILRLTQEAGGLLRGTVSGINNPTTNTANNQFKQALLNSLDNSDQNIQQLSSLIQNNINSLYQSILDNLRLIRDNLQNGQTCGNTTIAQIDQTISTVQGYQTQINNLNSSINQYQREIARLRSAINNANLSNPMTSQNLINDFTQQINNLDQNINNLSSQVSNLNRTLTNINSSVQGILSTCI